MDSSMGAESTQQTLFGLKLAVGKLLGLFLLSLV